MPEFDTYDCTECGEEFTALAGAVAAERGYCSPACATSGEDLA